MTDAIKGLRIIRVSKGARLVPLKEMVSAIYVNTQAKSQLGERLAVLQSQQCQPTLSSDLSFCTHVYCIQQCGCITGCTRYLAKGGGTPTEHMSDVS